MGGAVSSGRDNDELIDNLMGSNYIRTRAVEDVFRALDRAEYMTRDARDQAYKDVAWRSGSLHMSAPCIYSEVMENLELKPGLSFLNVGSGTGYLSTLVGLMLGSQGISHGIEVRQSVFEYANKRLRQFLENSPTLDEFDFCEPKFYHGNALCLAPLATAYDRVYCGAGCPSEYENYFKQLIKVGGILVMPLDDNLVQVKRLSESEWSSRTVLNVSFATLTIPSKEESANLLRLDEQTPVRLQVMARAAIRSAMRGGLRRRHPELRPPPPRAPPAKRSCPRRICIPVDDDSDIEGLGVLHDLYRDTGASEMNALLSFMLSMGHNRVAGALRYDTNASDDDDDDDDDAPPAARRGDDGDDGNDGAGSPFPFHGPEAPDSQSDDESSPGFLDDRARRVGLITLDFDGQNSDLGVPLLPVEPDSVIVRGDWPDTDSSDEEVIDEKVIKSDSAQFKPGGSGMGSGDARSSPSTSDGGRKSDKSKRKGSGDQNVKRRSGECSRAGTSDQENPDMPSEVEIYLGKTCEATPGTSKWSMEWEENGLVTPSSGDEELKVDSGVGDSPDTDKTDATPSDATPTDSTPSDTSPSDAQPSDSLSDDVDLDVRGGPAGRRSKRRAPDGGDARRVRLSILMKRGVKELPLPYALKKYVNLQRCFEF